MQHLIVGRSAAGLGRLLLAASGAAVSLLLLAGLLPGSVSLPVDAPLRAGLIAGGVLLGVGAMINGGCYLGSVLYLGTGNLNFLFTLAGIGLGLRATAALFPASIGVASGLRMASGPAWIVGVCVCATVIVLLTRRSTSPAGGWHCWQGCWPDSCTHGTPAGATVDSCNRCCRGASVS